MTNQVDNIYKQQYDLLKNICKSDTSQEVKRTFMKRWGGLSSNASVAEVDVLIDAFTQLEEDPKESIDIDNAPNNQLAPDYIQLKKDNEQVLEDKFKKIGLMFNDKITKKHDIINEIVDYIELAVPFKRIRHTNNLAWYNRSRGT
ncbi:MAG: hypothetical protein ACFE9L_12120 [Candidatus Hodarchaeota archaeon]